MPTHQPDAAEGGQQFEWSETLFTWLFRARIYLKRYWWIFLLTVSGGVGWQAYKEYNRPPSYQSHAEMQVQSMVQTQVVAGMGVAENYVGFYPTQIRIIESASLRQKAIDMVMVRHPEFRDRHPAPEIVSVSAAQTDATAFLDLYASGNDSEFTRDFLDCLMEQYLNQRDQENKDRVDKMINLENEQADKTGEEITQLQDKERQFLKDNKVNTATVDSEEVSVGKAAAALEDREAELESQQRIVAGIDLDHYVAGVDGKYDPVYVEEVDRALSKLGDWVQLSPDYIQAKQELLREYSLHDDYAKYWRDNHPRMLALNQDIGRRENNLEVLRSQIKISIQAALDDLKKEIDQVKVDLVAARDRAYTYEAMQSDYTAIKDDLEMKQKMLTSLNENKNGLDMAKDLTMDIFKISQDASPAYEMSPPKAKEIGQGAFVGVVLGSGLIFLLGALDGRVMSVEDLTQRFDEAMLGIIPMQKHVGGQVELLKNNDQRLMFAESCRNIRSSLLYMDKQGQRPQVIVITSSIPSEGKSTISANLAITLGFASSRTLLVDADLRRGQLHKRFGLKNELGLAEHIQDGVPIDEVIRPTGSENLEFISCGHYPAQPGELLMSVRFNETLKVLRQRYDFVVFDSPPVLATDDAVSFATRTDAVIFIVRAGYTRLRQIRTSLESLHRRGVNLYGMIVNFIDHREPSHYSYKYYDYYSYRPPESPTKPPFKGVAKDPFKESSSGLGKL